MKQVKQLSSKETVSIVSSAPSSPSSLSMAAPRKAAVGVTKRKSAPTSFMNKLPTNNSTLSKPMGAYVRSHSLPIKLGKQRPIKGILKILTSEQSLKVACLCGTKGKGEIDNTSSTSIEIDAPESSIANGASSTTSSERQRAIQFADILIREYARTIGDNPSCSSGPPVSIAWEYDPDTKIVSIDDYEENRPPRRNHFLMVLPRDVRQQILRREWDVTQRQIAEAVRNNVRVKNQRRATVNNLNKIAPEVEEVLENAARVLKRGFFLRKSVSKQAQELTTQHLAAERARRANSISEVSEDECEITVDTTVGKEKTPTDTPGIQEEETHSDEETPETSSTKCEDKADFAPKENTVHSEVLKNVALEI